MYINNLRALIDSSVDVNIVVQAIIILNKKNLLNNEAMQALLGSDNNITNIVAGLCKLDKAGRLTQANFTQVMETGDNVLEIVKNIINAKTTTILCIDRPGLGNKRRKTASYISIASSC